MAEENRTTSKDYIIPDIIHYSNCWEEARVLIQALQLKEGGVYLSIDSSGNNTLSLLAHNPSVVFAVDANPVQITCLEIRKVLIVHLSYEEVLQFLGINAGIDRITTCNSVRSPFSSESRTFLNEHHHKLIVTEQAVCRFTSRYRLTNLIFMAIMIY